MLKDYTFLSEQLELAPGNVVELHGLGLPDVLSLVAKHGPTLKQMFDEATAGGLDDLDFKVILNKLSSIPVVLIGDVIAAAAREPDGAEVAANLPIALQIEALEKIGRLTFATQGGVKNFVETVIRISNNLTSTMETLS